jgi:hypothetical protein
MEIFSLSLRVLMALGINMGCCLWPIMILSNVLKLSDVVPCFHKTPKRNSGFNVPSSRSGHAITMLVSKKFCTFVIFGE